MLIGTLKIKNNKQKSNKNTKNRTQCQKILKMKSQRKN